MTNTPTEARLADIAAEYGAMADVLPPQLEDGPGAASAFYMSCSLGEIAAMARELAALTKRVGELEGALTPSADTKADYIGEFQFTVTMMELDESDEPYECQRMVTVPWTTIKEIMAAISGRAARRLTGGEG